MPKKKASDDIPQVLVIKNRHMMNEIKPLDKSGALDDPAVSNPLEQKSDATIPRRDSSVAEDDDHRGAAQQDPSTSIDVQSDNAKEATPTESADKNNAVKADNTAVKPKDETTALEPETSNRVASSSDSAAASQPPEATTGGEGDEGNPPTPDVKQAVVDAAQTEKREHELESYIENKKFFVPIDTAAQKKSVKVSFGLTLLVVFLAVVLIDLMLDSGVILLVQKIPHTHFFSVKAPSE